MKYYRQRLSFEGADDRIQVWFGPDPCDPDIEPEGYL